MEYTNSDDATTEKLIENGNSSSSSSSQPRKGGLRTMPFIIGTLLFHPMILRFKSRSNAYDKKDSFLLIILDVLFLFSVNECLEKVASYGIMPNMILYLRDDYNMPIAKASYVLSTWSAMSNVLSIFGAFLSDSYLGRFNVITIGSFSSLLVSF